MKKLLTTIGILALLTSSLYAAPTVESSTSIMKNIKETQDEYGIAVGGIKDNVEMATRRLYCENQSKGWQPTVLKLSQYKSRGAFA